MITHWILLQLTNAEAECERLAAKLDSLEQICSDRDTQKARVGQLEREVMEQKMVADEYKKENELLGRTVEASNQLVSRVWYNFRLNK